MVERILRGRPASPGLAIGPLVRLPRVDVPAAPAAIERRGEHLVVRDLVEPEVERTRLATAVEQARDEIAALASSTDAMGAEILEFQQALLEDPALYEEALAKIAAGVSAATAWGR